MALFGIPKEEAQRIAREAAQKAVDTAVGALRSEYDSRINGAEGEIANLRGQLSGANGTLSQLETTIAEQAKKLEGSSAHVADLKKRLTEYEANLQRSGIVASITLPPSELTFATVLETARHVADEGYKQVRDYFLVQMAKKGYEKEMPDFTLFDKDSGINVSFYKSTDNGLPLNNGQQESKTDVWVSNFPEKFGLVEQQGQKRLYGNNYRLNNHHFALSVSGSEGWSAQLREELPDMLKAYMFGHALVRLNTNDRDTAIELMKTYGLEEHTPLLNRTMELMGNDATLAAKIRDAYAVETR